MSIFIFSRPIHSGKTTELRQWCDKQKNIAGILMPDIDGRRKIIDLQTKKTFDIECTDPANTKELLASVGRFHFYTSLFEKGNSIIEDALDQTYDWLIIDEVGKLELQKKGFYKSIAKAIEDYQGTKENSNLLITVRESLCKEVILFFKIKDPRVIHQLDDIG